MPPARNSRYLWEQMTFLDFDRPAPDSPLPSQRTAGLLPRIRDSSKTTRSKDSEYAINAAEPRWSRPLPLCMIGLT
jgi:hypothetical protein